VWAVLFTRDILMKTQGARGERLIAGMMPVAVIFFASAVTLVGVSLMTAPPSSRTVNKFVPARR